MRKHAIATAVVALLALAGCGSSGGDATDLPTGSGPSAEAARDKGPLCVGTAAADGLHVLRGGGFRLPGGGGVQYETAHADGTTRTATLRDGASYRAGQTSRTVKPGQQLTVSGHVYTVSQICSYRVVLEPKNAQDRAKADAAPASMKSVGGAADAGLCFTTNATVRAAAANGFPLRGGTWTLVNSGGNTALSTGLSVAVMSVDPAAETAFLSATCAAIPVAVYRDAAVGDTVEFAGVEFKVSDVSRAAVRLTRDGV